MKIKYVSSYSDLTLSYIKQRRLLPLKASYKTSLGPSNKIFSFLREKQGNLFLIQCTLQYCLALYILLIHCTFQYCLALYISVFSIETINFVGE